MNNNEKPPAHSKIDPVGNNNNNNKFTVKEFHWEIFEKPNENISKFFGHIY